MPILSSKQILLLKWLILLSSVSDSLCMLYKSPTSLDEYGSIPQINYASLASKLHSAPTIIAIAGSSIIAMYMEQKRIGVMSRQRITVLSKSEDGVLATVGSGLSADIAFINRLLRKDVMNSWERYDSFPGCRRIAHTTSRIMLAFMNYDDEISDGSIDILNDENGERLNIGRPFGANIAVLELGRVSRANFQMVEPSGVIFSRDAHCFGIGSDTGNQLLRQKFYQGMTAHETRDVCLDILSDILLRHNFISDADGQDVGILVESLDANGFIHIERFPIRDIQK